MGPHFVLLLLCFSTLVSSFGFLPPTTENPSDEWPYDFYLVQAKFTIDKEWGGVKVSAKKDKTDNVRKLNGYLTLSREVPTDIKGAMVAKMKLNNNWVTAFRQLPRPFNEFVEVNKDIAKAIFNHIGLKQRAPLDAGNYTFDNFKIEPNFFPRAMPKGTYIVQLFFSTDEKEIAFFEILAILE